MMLTKPTSPEKELTLNKDNLIKNTYLSNILRCSIGIFSIAYQSNAVKLTYINKSAWS